VRLEGGFWGERQELNSAETIPHCAGWIERLGWVQNFLHPEDRIEPDWRDALSAHIDDFKISSDSDVYKVLEALAWETGRADRPELEAMFDRIVDAVSQAQEPDGYLNTFYGLRAANQRYMDLRAGLELYNYGHLIQAAVARLRTHGPDKLSDVAIRVADHVCDTFGPGKRAEIDGHPEIEVALVELYRATGETRYLDEAAWFIEQRGHGILGEGRFGAAYYQDDVPVRAADVLRGHAVRALYLACGAVDIAVETGDDELLHAVQRQWERTVARRTYLTGGMGARHEDEGFGEDHELPPDRAYAETCAGIASVMLSWRLLLATGGAHYADFAERALFNIMATSLGSDGCSFFYANTLHQRSPGLAQDAAAENARANQSLRTSWFGVPCCPTNVARTLASLAGYVATRNEGGIQVHQYASGAISASLPDGRPVRLRVSTDYPLDGRVVVTVEETTGGAWSLSIRVPGWSSGATITVQGEQQEVSPGYAHLERTWQPCDQIVLDIPMSARWTWPEPRVDAVRGTVAVERGPLVYCLEAPAHSGLDLARVCVDTARPPKDEGYSVRATGYQWLVTDTSWPYGRLAKASFEELQLVYRPYYDWANHGPSSMRIWVPAADILRQY
jgi:DUF1680 family protein